jgi:hypothetical protein
VAGLEVSLLKFLRWLGILRAQICMHLPRRYRVTQGRAIALRRQQSLLFVPRWEC